MYGLPLQPDRDAMTVLGAEVLDFATGFVAGRSTAPASNRDDPGLGALLARLAVPPPEDGRPVGPVLAELGEAATHGIDTAGAGYLGFIPGGGLFAAALGDLLTAAINRLVTVPPLGPALTQIEAAVVAWLCDLAGLPAGSRGILTSCGSMANFSAIVTARVDRLPPDFLSGTIYASEHTHHSVAKSARLAGFPADAVRAVPTTAELRVDPAALATMVTADRRAGRRPFLVVANAGTTNTGAVDPLPALADVAADHGLWLHVDAAYGGFFLLTERGRHRLQGIERADSVTLDPHKGMFLPYGTGSLVVRDGERLRRAHSVDAPYLQDLAGDWDLPSFADLSPELSRECRGLRVWLPLQLHGVGAFRQALDEKLDLAARAHAALAEMPELELPWAPELTVVTIRHRDGDAATRALLERVNSSRRVFLSSTTIGGRFTVRMCVLSHRTHVERVDEAVALVAAAAQAVAGEVATRP